MVDRLGEPAELAETRDSAQVLGLPVKVPSVPSGEPENLQIFVQKTSCPCTGFHEGRLYL